MASLELIRLSHLTRLADQLALGPDGIEQLVAIDRVARALATPDADEPSRTVCEAAGYALAGPTALHGVYLIRSALVRVPEVFWLAPVTATPAVSPAELAAFCAAALPGGAVLAEPDGTSHDARFILAYDGVTGKRFLPFRVQASRLLFDLPTDLHQEVAAGRLEQRYLVHPHARLFTWIVRPADTIMLPVAFVEEMLLRLVLDLSRNPLARASLPVDIDVLMRADDMRVLVTHHSSNVRDSFDGPIRTMLGRLAESNLRRRATTDMPIDQMRAAVDQYVKSIVEGAISSLNGVDVRVLPDSVRPRHEQVNDAAIRTFRATADGLLRRLTVPFDIVEFAQLVNRQT